MKPRRDYRLVYCIGPPGSGKTTWLNTTLSDGYLIFDRSAHLDAILRGRRHYYEDARSVANAMLWSGFVAALERGNNVGVANGGKTRAERSRVIEMARAHGYHVALLVFLVDADLCLARCKADLKRPKTAHWRLLITNWYNGYEPADPRECDELVFMA